MVLKGLLDRFGRRKEEQQESPPVAGNDGWVELVNGRLVVHDPVVDGRYATITPGDGVRLWINDEEVDGPTAVTASDQVRFDIDPDPLHFVDVQITTDEMAVEMTLTADPYRLADTVTVEGQHQVRLLPACSPKARTRLGAPKTIVLDRLKSLGVTFGIDEVAIDQALKGQAGKAVIIARGQEPQAPAPGEWTWQLDEWSLVEAGQIIASYHQGQANRPRITVKGQETQVYEDLPEPQVYLQGNGTRLVPGGRLVASTTGRARAVSTPQGYRVHIFPVQRIEGDLTGELDAKADVLVHGSVRSAKVHTTGELLVTGSVEKSEVHAEVITVLGAVSESCLCTVPAGHFIPLKSEFAWIQKRLEGIREAIHAHQPVKEETFREVQSFVRALRRKAEQMGIHHPDYQGVSDEIAKVFLGVQAVSGLDLPTAGRLLMSLGKLKGAEAAAAGPRDIRAASLHHATVWAGRGIHVTERVVGSVLYCGGTIQTPGDATLSQSELVAGAEIKVGVLASVRGTAPVTVRAGRVLAEEVQAGCVVEFGADRKEFKSDLQRVATGANAKGQLVVRQQD